MANLKFRYLEDDEAAKLPPESFPGFGKKPDFVTMVGLVDEDTDQIVATVILQSVLHVEGIWLEPSVRGNSEGLRAGIFQLLTKFLRDHIVDGFLSQIFGGKTEEWVKTLGAKPMPGTTYYFDCR